MVDLNLSEAHLFDGNLAMAMSTAERAADQARGLRHRALEIATLRHLSVVLLAIGEAKRAEKYLADSSALARAVGLTAARRASHVLRAQATLEAHHGDRAAAAAAADRLLRQIGESRSPDPEGHLPIAYAILARASAALGDTRMVERTSLHALRQARIEPVTVQVLVHLHLGKALLTAGRVSDALDYAARASAACAAHTFRFYAWEAARVQATAKHETLPPAGVISEGLTPAQVERLLNRPVTP
jgi:ATP/maltotriose-dependent transcriptional regulator MalT